MLILRNYSVAPITSDRLGQFSARLVVERTNLADFRQTFRLLNNYNFTTYQIEITGFIVKQISIGNHIGF
ncbi:MAG: hypothetical protein ACI9EW_002042 [Cellvibrionaceae bacterium]|jgi:hypothetical protein